MAKEKGQVSAIPKEVVELLASPAKVVFYGIPGVGKTVLLGTCSEDERLSPALFLDFESGTMSVSSKLHKVTKADFLENLPPKGKIAHLKLRTWNDLTEVLDALYDHQENNPLPYKTLLIDSITEINTTSLTHAVDSNPRNSTIVPILQDYGTSSAQMRQIIRDFRDLDLHVFFSALAQENKDETTGVITIKPSLTGKLADEVAALVDIVGYLTTETVEDNNVQRVMYFQPMLKAIAKDRTEGGKLGVKLVNPTLPHIFDLITGVRKVDAE